MAKKTKFRRIADLQVEDGTYEKEGREYKRSQAVGTVFSSPHGSRMFIKLYATATSPSRILDLKVLPEVQIRVEQPEEEATAT